MADKFITAKQQKRRDKRKRKEQKEKDLRRQAREEKKAREERLKGVPYNKYTNEELKEEIGLQLDRRDKMLQLGVPDMIIDNCESTTLTELLTIARERNMRVDLE